MAKGLLVCGLWLLLWGVAWAKERPIPFAQQVRDAEGMIIGTFRETVSARYNGVNFSKASFKLQQVAGIYNRHIIYQDNFKISLYGLSDRDLSAIEFQPGKSYLLLLKKGPTGFELVYQGQSIYQIKSTLGEMYLISEVFKTDETNGHLRYPAAQVLLAQKWRHDLPAIAQEEDRPRIVGRQMASEEVLGILQEGGNTLPKVGSLSAKEEAEIDEFLTKLWPVIILVLLSLAARIVQFHQNKSLPRKDLR